MFGADQTTLIGQMIDKLPSIQKMRDGPERTQALQKFRDTSGIAQRVFVRKYRVRAAVFTLSDSPGRPRIQLTADTQGAAKLEFLDEKGPSPNRFRRPPRLSQRRSETRKPGAHTKLPAIERNDTQLIYWRSS
jgi:hypothetical protein